MTSHRCPKPGCTVDVGHDYLMCAVHWRRVPKPLKDEVWRTFKAGRLSKEHVAAMGAAIEAVSRSGQNSAREKTRG